MNRRISWIDVLLAVVFLVALAIGFSVQDAGMPGLSQTEVNRGGR